jgi:hypothetical protein
VFDFPHRSLEVHRIVWYTNPMSWFTFFGVRRTPRTNKAQPHAVKQAAREALKRYEKTFIDLARYDRGERIGSLHR